VSDPVDEGTRSENSGPVTTKKRGLWSRLYHGETDFDIVSRWKVWFGISAVLLLIGGAALVAKGGLNLGIDFTGGTIWKVDAGDATVDDVQDAMAELGYEDVQVQEVTQVSDGQEIRQFNVEAETSAEPSSATTDALEAAEADLDDVRGTVPEASLAAFDRLYGNLSEIHGPFAEDVPQELADLQTELDALPAALEEAEEAQQATVADAAATRLEEQVEALEALETAQRSASSLAVSEALAELTGTPVEQVTVDTVGPSWGQQISEKARTALIVFLIAIALFITIRFEAKMALATVVALFHDLLMVVGLYALLGLPVTPSTVVALLTMLGFSIYDGIVVFDRVAENAKLLTKRSKMTYTDMANMSLNQVLMRSLNTSITTLLPILSVLIVGSLILGASTLEEFGVALFLGLLSGAYSSIFIATPLLALLKEREPRYRELRTQIAERGHGSVDEPDADDDDPVKAAVLAGGSAPRPRKQGRRR
jgi:preprotein translocase subunit SecF